jgi:hypothetical protein
MDGIQPDGRTVLSDSGFGRDRPVLFPLEGTRLFWLCYSVRKERLRPKMEDQEAAFFQGRHKEER